MLNKILLKFFGVRIISSQCGEDFILETLLANRKRGFYVDVGANHPIKFNNTLLFYNKGWTGINIEPNSSRMWLFNILRRKDINLNIGIGLEKSNMSFYSFKESTLSTFDSKSAEEYQKMGHTLKEIIEVPILPLREILEKNLNGRSIDILSIDTEGFDMAVLQSNDWNIYRPRFVVLETLEYKNNNTGQKLNNIFDPYMESVNYRKVAETHINTIYEKTD